MHNNNMQYGVGRHRAVRYLLLAWCACAVICPGVVLSAEKAKHEPPLLKHADIEDPRRLVFLPVATVIAELRIRPGMRILDLGSGCGYLTFPMADALGETGQVVATDTMPDVIDFMRAKIARLGYRNILPVLVQPEDDPFYRDQRFDLILMCEVACHLGDRVSLFRRLRTCLNPGGRIVIIDTAVRPSFYSGYFEDVNRICRDLRREGDTFPVYARLDGRLKSYIKGGDLARPAPPEMKGLLAKGFNDILRDPRFFDDIDVYLSRRIGDGDHEKGMAPLLLLNSDTAWYVVRWLAYQLQDAGTFEKNIDDMSAAEKKSIALLNMLILRRMFPDPRVLSSNYFVSTTHMLAPGGGIREMKDAGYLLARRPETLPHHFFLEFVPRPRWWDIPAWVSFLRQKM